MVRKRRFRAQRQAALLWATGVLLVSPAVLAQPLPDGDSGIAAQYPEDDGIADDPAVLLHEDFESIAGASLTSEGSAFDSVYGENSITDVAADVHAGSQAVKRTHSSPGSFGAVKFLGAGYDTLHIRYYMKYDPLFPGCHHTGGGIYAAAGSSYTQIGDITGVRPDGTNHFQAWLDDMAPFFDWSPPGNDTPPGWLHFYCYNMDQGSEYGDLLFPDGTVIPGASGVDFGAEFVARPNYNPPRGEWASYEVMVQANTPGSADGRIAFWVDGDLVGDFPNLRLRSTASLQPNHAALSTYSSEVHDHKTIWYDDVVVATSYIGPMFHGSSPGDDAGAGEDADGGTGEEIDAGPGAGVDGGTGPGGDDPPESGCGCRVRSGTPAAIPALIAFLGLAFFLRPRRRRAP